MYSAVLSRSSGHTRITLPCMQRGYAVDEAVFFLNFLFLARWKCPHNTTIQNQNHHLWLLDSFTPVVTMHSGDHVLIHTMYTLPTATRYSILRQKCDAGVCTHLGKALGKATGSVSAAVLLHWYACTRPSVGKQRSQVAVPVYFFVGGGVC